MSYDIESALFSDLNILKLVFLSVVLKKKYNYNMLPTCFLFKYAVSGLTSMINSDLSLEEKKSFALEYQ